MLCWNVWSILNDEKRNNVLQVLEDYKIHIACITETWFDAKNGKFTADIREAGYEIVHDFRDGQRGGGTAILYKNNLNAKPGEASSSKYGSFEFSIITLTIDKSKTMIVCVYRKQEQSCTLFCDEIELLIESIFDSSDILIIVGDFNLWIDVEGDADAEKVVSLMNAYGLSQIVDKQTHREGHTLDHVYVNPFQLDLKCDILDDTFEISDHFPVIVDLPVITHKPKKRTISYRNTRDIDIESLIAGFKNMFEELNDEDNATFEMKV